MAATYEEYLDQYLARHQNRITNQLSGLAGYAPAAGALAAVVRRDPRWLLHGVLAGVVVASIAHLFQPGTLRAEYAAILGHPVWAARAERARMRRNAR